MPPYQRSELTGFFKNQGLGKQPQRSMDIRHHHKIVVFQPPYHKHRSVVAGHIELPGRLDAHTGHGDLTAVSNDASNRLHKSQRIQVDDRFILYLVKYLVVDALTADTVFLQLGFHLIKDGLVPAPFSRQMLKIMAPEHGKIFRGISASKGIAAGLV